MPDTADEFAPQFLGFMRRSVIEALQLGDPASKPTWHEGCFGAGSGARRARRDT
jgi:hypothetical protein